MTYIYCSEEISFWWESFGNTNGSNIYDIKQFSFDAIFEFIKC